MAIKQRDNIGAGRAPTLLRINCLRVLMRRSECDVPSLKETPLYE